MRVDEKKVKDNLLHEERIIVEEKRIEEEKNKAFADSIAKLSNGLRIQADRSVDKNQPPIIFDIEKARSSIRPVKYSELGDKVRYVKLSHNLENDFFKNAKVLLTENGIVVSALGGIVCFKSNGDFKEIVCQNNNLYINKRGYLVTNKEIIGKYRGVYGKPYAMENNIYYRYADYANNQIWIIEYNMLQPKSIEFNRNTEQQTKPKGTRKMQEISKVNMREKDMIALDKNHWVSKKIKWNSSQTGYFLSIHNYFSDTVCQLKDFDPIKNFSSSTYRSVQGTDLYRLNGSLHFRQSFNDTIFKFEAINRVKPLYVVDFGKREVSSTYNAMHPKFDLKDKFIHYDLLETNRFMFVFYTQDYACPNTKEKGTLLYNCFVFDKNTNEQFHAFIDEKPAKKNTPIVSNILNNYPVLPDKGIINDLDYGISTWKFEQAEDGKLYKLIKASKIKKHINSNPNNQNQKNRELLEKIANYSKHDDLFLMIIEYR